MPEPLPLTRLELDDRSLILQIVWAYQLILGRNADPDGLVTYVEALRNGTPLRDIVRTFLGSPEYRRKHFTDHVFSEDVATTAAGRAHINIQESSIDAVLRKIRTSAEHDRPLLPILLGDRRPEPENAHAYRWWLSDFQYSRKPDLQPSPQPTIECPAFTFVVMLDESNSNALLDTVSSIAAQAYKNLEVILLSRTMSARSLRRILRVIDENQLIRHAQSLRHRIFPFTRSQPFSGVIETALRVSSGSHICVIASGDRLVETATLEFFGVISRATNCDVIYSDNDCIDSDGFLHSPKFRTAWDPDRVLATGDISPCVVYSRSLLRRLQLGRDTPAELEVFDLFVRATSSTLRSRIKHIPLILHHQLTAADPSHTTKQLTSIAIHNITKVVNQAISSGDSICQSKLNPSCLRIVRHIPTPSPLVSIVIPTRDRVDLLQACVTGVLNETTYSPMQVVIIDNGSRQVATKQYLAGISKDRRVRILTHDSEFNWGRLCNFGCRKSEGEILVLLNNDVEVIEPDWLDELVRQAVRPEVGIVGAKLLYPDGTLQHGGMVLTPRGAGVHVMRGMPSWYRGYMDQLTIVREVTAVTGACLAIRRGVFEEVGGIEDNDLRVGCSDADLCLRVASRGYRIIWTPYACLVHKELSTRGADDTPDKIRRAEREERYIARKWGALTLEDVFWNPSLGLEDGGRPALATPPRWIGARAAER